MERRIKASHPDFARLNELNQMLAMLKNPQAHFNLLRSALAEPITAEDRAFVCGRIERDIAGLLDGGIFRDWIDR